MLILGDSISMGYTPWVRELLGGEAVVARAMREDRRENCQGTTFGVQHVERWVAQDGGDWDVIHFNFGLHDLKHVDPDTGKNSNDPDDPPQASPERYEELLDRIAAALAATGARPVFATTTPVPDGGVRPYRVDEDVVLYNSIARRVVAARGIGVVDLYGFVASQAARLQRPGDVHFTPAGSALLGAKVAAAIRSAARR